MALVPKVWAAGLQEIQFPNIPLAPKKITVDGKLNEWKGLAGYEYNPLLQVIKSGGDPAVAAILANPPSVNFKTCYDTDALYVAVDWHDQKPGTNTTAAGNAAHWSDGGEGFELHIRTDRVLHLACWPVPDGMAVMVRYDSQKNWRNVASSLVAARGAFGDTGKNYGQELRIPWSVITATGKPPADARAELGVDFAWNAVPPSLVRNVRNAIMATDGSAPGISLDFLTARPASAAAGYLPNPADWGSMVLGASPGGDETVRSSEGTTSLALLHVSKANVRPATDGSLSNWDIPSFQTAAWLGALWGDRFTCRVAAQSDADNLYLAVHYATFGPSNTKVESTQQGYGGGDALQIRVSNGVKNIALCGWYDSQSKKPALTADEKDLPSPFLLQQGAQESFKPDGHGGYTQTVVLPWKLLFGGAPKSAQPLKATLQLWFADLTNRYSLHARTALEKHSALSVAYTMPANGQLTLGLYDKGGQLLKWLAQDDYRYAGENKEAWDGLDQYGKPVVPGSYILKGIYHALVTTDYKMTVCDPGNPPWPSPDNKGDWLSDESNPQAAVTDGKWVFLGTPNFEKGSSIIAVDEAGQKQWGFNGSQAHCVSLALNGDYLYALYSGPERTDRNLFNGRNAIEKAILVCIDKKTGQPAKFTREIPKMEVADWPYRNASTFLWDLRNNKSFTPQIYGGQPHYFCYDIGETTNALGLAAVGGKLYAALNYDNKLVVIDAETGKPTGEAIPLDNPVGLCAFDDHTLLAVSGRQIVKVNVNNKEVTPLATSHLVAPHSVTTDKTGNLYVSDWATSFQVKIFDDHGNFVRAIGKEGGRPWVGKWNPDGMLVPRGIAVTDEGRLWVAEDDGTPRRVSVWDARTGAFLKDYIGPTPYGCCSRVWADPNDSTLFHVEGTRFKLDYEKKTYIPQAIDYRRAGLDAPFTPNGDAGCDQVRILYRDGQEYAVICGGLGGNSVTVLRREGDVYEPVASVGSVFGGANPGLENNGTVIDTTDDVGHHGYPNGKPAYFKDHARDNYSWTDLNHDFLVQPDEMKWVKAAKVYQAGSQNSWSAFWGNAMSDGWSIFFASSFQDAMKIYRLDVKGWTHEGAPIYDIADARPIITEARDNNILNLYVSRDNKLIVSYDLEWGKSPDALACYDLNGKKLWSIARPQRYDTKSVNASGSLFDFILPGLGNVFGTWAWHGNFRPYLITTDGLYVGTLLENTKLGPAAIWGESPVFYFQSPDGTPYVVNAAADQAHILQIKGIEKNSCGRFEGNYQLVADDVQKAAAMREIPEVKPPPLPVIGIPWMKSPPAIDGDLSDWNLHQGVSLNGGHGRSAQVVLGRDATNLYLAYQVHEPTKPLVNEGGNWQTLFITGDCVDLMLGTDPKPDVHRREAVPGDERILFTVFQGKPIAVLYQPSVPGAANPVQFGSLRIDKVIKLDAAKVAVRRDEINGSYTVEAEVSLKDLGIDPNEKNTLRGDVGVVYADEIGRSRALRLYYYNKHTEMVSDLATEATLQPSEWGVIQFPLGANLLKNGDFEDPLVNTKDDADKGWWVSPQANGSDGTLSAESPYTGHRSLLLESPVSMTFPPEAYTNRDLGYKLWGFVAASQRVPVMPGHQYSLRYHFRTEDFQADDRRPGHPPGSIGYGGRIEWGGHVLATERSRNIGSSSETLHDWQTVKDFNHGWDLPKVYTAPEGADSANVIFTMSTRASGRSPKLFIDDVEFVDVTH